MKKQAITKTITRKHVLNAIKKENLVTGSFFEDSTEDEHDKSDYAYAKPGCEVCLVGGVLRQASFTKAAKRLRVFGGSGLVDGIKQLTRGSVGIQGNVGMALKKKQYLRAMSIKFETIFYTENIGDLGARKELRAWVKQNIPKRFKTKMVVKK